MATSSRVHGWTSLKTPVLSIILILFTRFQFSHVYSSPHAEVSHGVPEGSMVEPILFTLPKNLLLPVNQTKYIDWTIRTLWIVNFLISKSRSVLFLRPCKQLLWLPLPWHLFLLWYLWAEHFIKYCILFKKYILRPYTLSKLGLSSVRVMLKSSLHMYYFPILIPHQNNPIKAWQWSKSVLIRTSNKDHIHLPEIKIKLIPLMTKLHCVFKLIPCWTRFDLRVRNPFYFWSKA